MKWINWAGGTLLILLSGINCKTKATGAALPGYDLAHPVIYKMPRVLDEVSGITFLNGDATTIFAEQDEEGKLFFFHLGDEIPVHVKFSKKGDYEDLTIANQTMIMLRSDGTLFGFSMGDIHQKEIPNVQEWDNLIPEGEYESLFYDSIAKKIYLLCKNCAEDTKQQIVGYTLVLGDNGQLKRSGDFKLLLPEKSNGSKGKFKPSALAKHPITGEWYVLSGVTRQLAIANTNFEVQSRIDLAPPVFPQPEGMAFDRKGNLYISNEIAEADHGTILQFNYQKP